MSTQEQRAEYLRRTELARERFTPTGIDQWNADARTDAVMAVDLVAQTVEAEAKKNPVREQPAFLGYPAINTHLFGQTMHDVGKAVMDALIGAGWSPASRAAAPPTSRSVVCRSDCGEIPGYCSSGIGCLGQAAPPISEEPA